MALTALPQGGYFTFVAAAWATLAVAALALGVYRYWLSACRDRHRTKRDKRQA